MLSTVQQDCTGFWADGFDMDLLTLQPNLREIVGPVADTPLWTLGSLDRHGRFSHPCCWNTARGMAAFFWDQVPAIERDTNGWCSIHGFTTSSPLCSLSLLDAIRDCWLHTYAGFLLLPTGFDPVSQRPPFRLFVEMAHYRWVAHFAPMMAHVRVHRRMSEFEFRSMLADAEDWAAAAGRAFKEALSDR